MTVFNIKVYFDTVCPWCYIGHKTLDRAVLLYQKTYPGGSADTFLFEFVPYYLNPDDPDKGIPWAEKVVIKNGEEMAKGIRTHLQRVGKANGIEFSFGSKIGKTRDSHRLIQFAPPESRKGLLEAIFQAHFEGDADITSHTDLAKAAVAAGLDEDAASALLRGNDHGDEVDELAAQAREQGICSVPTIEIAGQRIKGAEEASEFYEALVRVKEGEGISP